MVGESSGAPRCGGVCDGGDNELSDVLRLPSQQLLVGFADQKKIRCLLEVLYEAPDPLAVARDLCRRHLGWNELLRPVESRLSGEESGVLGFLDSVVEHRARNGRRSPELFDCASDVLLGPPAMLTQHGQNRVDEQGAPRSPATIAQQGSRRDQTEASRVFRLDLVGEVGFTPCHEAVRRLAYLPPMRGAISDSSAMIPSNAMVNAVSDRSSVSMMWLGNKDFKCSE